MFWPGMRSDLIKFPGNAHTPPVCSHRPNILEEHVDEWEGEMQHRVCVQLAKSVYELHSKPEKEVKWKWKGIYYFRNVYIYIYR